jgi:hypothetical protein
MSNKVVSIPPPGVGTISYFSADRLGIDLGPTTTASGAFISLDAPFGSVFSVRQTTTQRTVYRIGGRIDGKVTIVILKFAGGAGT